MDAQIIYALALFSFILFVFMRLKKTESTPNLPPGPKKLPIIGNLLNLGSLPHRQLRDLAQKYGPLMHLKLGEVSTVVVSSAEVAREVMKTHDIIFASRPKVLATEILCYDTTDVAFAPYGDYWRQLRKICVLELLSTKRVQSFSPVREEEMTNLIKWVASKEGSVINLSEAVLSSIYTITSRAAFGKRFKGHEEFIAVIKESQKAVAGLNIADLYPSAKWLQHFSGLRINLEKLHKTTDRIMENIINEHKQENSKGCEAQLDKQEDLVDVLLKFQDGNDLGFCLTNDNIKAIIVDVFAAGGDTSATAIEWTMSELIKNPKVMAKAQAEVRQVFSGRGTIDETVIDELKYLKSVIREIFRLRPPAPLLLPRESRQACEINGFHIPDKCRVIVNAWAIGRDANYWTEPERFYPERFLDSSVDFKGANFELIPFGAGRRMCPGIAFGLKNVELPLALFLYDFDWKLPNRMRNEDLDMSETFGSTTRRKNDLCLIPVAYHPILPS